MFSTCIVWIVLGEAAASSQAGVIATDTSNRVDMYVHGVGIDDDEGCVKIQGQQRVLLCECKILFTLILP